MKIFVRLMRFCILLGFYYIITAFLDFLKFKADHTANSLPFPESEFEVFQSENAVEDIQETGPVPEICSDFFPDLFYSLDKFRLSKETSHLPHHFDPRGMPYGLDNLTYLTLMEVLASVDSKPFPKLPADSTCLIVGSSGILTRYNISSQINQYDYVFRFNNAPVFTHRHFVGSKTSFYTTYFSSLRDAIRNGRKDQATQVFYIFTYPREFIAPLYYISPAKFNNLSQFYFTPNATPVFRDPSTARIYQELKRFYLGANITFMSPSFGIHVRNYLLKSNRARPTSGLMGLVLAISMCPNRPDIAGFSLGGKSAYPYHYYSAFKKSQLTSVHNATLETAAIKRMFGCRMLGTDLTNGVLGPNL